MIKNIDNLIRKNIRTLQPYSSARSEFSGAASVFLDANENGFGSPLEVGLTAGANRYPDPLQKELKCELSKLKGIPEQNIFIGNGSDEAIDLLVRIACEPGEDSIMVLPPTYGMYEVAAKTNAVGVQEVPLTATFQPDLEAIQRAITPQTKILFLCSPNNPTGNLFSEGCVRALLEIAPGLVVIDEAYIDFASAPSFLTEISRYPNLVVLQTFSKAWGLAGIRCGMAFGDPRLIHYLTVAKLPYNVNMLSQRVALEALRTPQFLADTVARTLQERTKLIDALLTLNEVQRVYASDANFLLVKVSDPNTMCTRLLKEGVVIRNRNLVQGCAGCVRITIGTEEENERLLALLRGASLTKSPARSGIVVRKTRETEIEVRISLDGQGRTKINTGVGFFDHMLEQLGKHSGIDLTIQARGDLHIDEHHTVEDVGIALGAALAKALGDKRGIERYGFLLPMDEALAQVAIDLSGRSAFQWKVPFTREKVGDVPTEMFSHFFHSFGDAAKMALHIEARGENDHHIIEGVFKGVARALKMAIRRDSGTALPSTKGVL